MPATGDNDGAARELTRRIGSSDGFLLASRTDGSSGWLGSWVYPARTCCCSCGGSPRCESARSLQSRAGEGSRGGVGNLALALVRAEVARAAPSARTARKVELPGVAAVEGAEACCWTAGGEGCS